MKSVKRVISLLLVIVMSLGIFTGCKEEKKEKEEGERVLTVGVPQDTTIPDYDKNALSLYLEKETGIDIKWVFFAGSASNYKQQLTLMCTGKEKLPDVLLGFTGLGHYVVNQFGEDGYIIDLRDLIDKYAVNYKKMMKDQPEKVQKYIEEKGTNTNNGSFYAMPLNGAVAGNDWMQSMMYINQKWLDKVGMKAPTNIKELEAVCEAFLTKDPNGNGEADELPMLGSGAMRYWMINAFVQYDANNFNVNGGKVWDPVTTPEFRKGIEFVNYMTEKGYYSELGYTISTNEQKNLISPIEGVGSVGIFCGNHEVMTNATTNALEDYTALGVLADATGKGGYNIIDEPYNYIHWSAFITEDCENPKLAMEFLDAFYTDEQVSRARYGEKDVHWKYEEGENSYGTKSYVNVIEPEAFFDGALNATLGTLLGCHTAWNYMSVHQEGTGRVAEVDRLHKEQWAIYNNSGKKTEGQLSGLIYTSQEYEIREMKATEVTNYLSSQELLFSKGELDVKDDAAWNDFLETLDSLGRGELLKIAQDAYSRKVK